jgi:predicted CoA-substrate-specific enzyme activase
VNKTRQPQHNEPLRPHAQEAADGRTPRFLGIDVGAETIKLVEVVREAEGLRWSRRRLVEHGKDPAAVLAHLLRDWDWATVLGAAASGRFSKAIALPRVPAKQAQARAFRFLGDNQPATVVSIGSHGFSVLELRPNHVEVFRENSRCSQGTGNFLRQLVERFSLTIEEASALADSVDKAAALSGRCPVILKSDMTHLANKGEDRGRILAGLFDAVCENVLVLLKPELSPKRVALIGGVSRSIRVRNAFREFLSQHGMVVWPVQGDDGLFFEALGCAVIAADSPDPAREDQADPARGADAAPARSASRPRRLPALEGLFRRAESNKLEKVSPLRAALPAVRRMPPQPLASVEGRACPLILGFDIGSTGSKAVALEPVSGRMVWDGYRRTLGDPVGAAQDLLRQFVAGGAGHCPVVSLGVTGSGREIVGSLMTTCYGKEVVFILNEIAAHAEGARHYEPAVDTIFEIGGQDAKYIRLAEGRVVDCAMNEACSAGTGSFIEEQGGKFSGIRDVVHLGEEALAAQEGVSLGQHCSVFMAEIIDEAVAGGVDQRSIIAGLYDSIIQNYLHRVKGNRSVGNVIFCQGMPFSSDALAAAVAQQTGSEVIIPPNPGTVGALGIALLTRKEITGQAQNALELDRFLRARVETKDNFLCKATTGCGGSGNLCRIDRLRTVVGEKRQSFTWGGGCALHDKATRKRKLPDRAPDPFREREEMIKRLADRLVSPAQTKSSSTGAPERGPGGSRTAGGSIQEAGVEPPGPRKTVAVSDEFMLKGLFPFFATFLREIGFELLVIGGCDHNALKRGIAEANVPYCAPMQQFHGLASRMAETGADYLFLPMVRSLPRVDGEPHAVTCPIVQASPDILRWDLGKRIPGRVLSPVIDVDQGGLGSATFMACCQELAREAGCSEATWKQAHRLAVRAQDQFDEQCLEIGRNALKFCREQGIVPVVVLGRPYTIYNTVLNSNVPAILREQGTIAIPVDCYPVGDEVPVFADMYWSYGQRILQAAHQIRRAPGVYSLYCSNYSCGPDSFNLHFFAYVMEGKPFAIIETDGHSGDAGTKTRLEAFLHCVAQDLSSGSPPSAASDFRNVELRRRPLQEVSSRSETLIVPWMGDGSQVVAACFRGLGVPTECLPMPDGEALRLGRRHTSGKECLPMCLTLGNLLKRVDHPKTPGERLAVLMPNAHGPCREGTYNLLHNITLERLGHRDRVRVWTLDDEGYLDDFPAGLSALLFSAVMAGDLLLDALHHVRPIETRPGAAEEIYRRHLQKLIQHLERQAAKDLSIVRTLWQATTGQFFGVRKLLEVAGAEFAAVRAQKEIPTVMLVGEIYVRCDPFANDFVVEKLEQRGLRAKLAPFTEWLEYSDLITKREIGKTSVGSRLSSRIQSRIQEGTYGVMANQLNWSKRPAVREAMEAVENYLRTALRGEAVLTVGTPLHEWREQRIDGVVSVGPLECMPNKIAEAQFFHVAEQEGLLALSLPLNGDPIDAEVLDNFAFEVHARFKQKASPRATPSDRLAMASGAPVGCGAGGCAACPPATHLARPGSGLQASCAKRAEPAQ